MCGIVAALDWTGNASTDQVQRALSALRHRGPDGTGLWCSPGGHATLGHARLSIIDLPSGAQPISNESDQIHIIVNGEFYGFERIRHSLEACGHRFKTKSDSEILLHLYEDFGVECLHHLCGEFAFVLWDERTHTLFAARDRFGIKPLFFSSTAESIYFASEIKALHALGIAPAWDEQGFFEKLVLHSPVDGRTVFRGVSELPPAHYLLARDGHLTQHCYWDFDFPGESETSVHVSDDDYAAQLAELLSSAVQTRMRSDVPVACYLSGGIDSGSVLGLMSRHTSTPVNAFCLSFSDPAYDESSFAAETATHCNARLHFVPVTQADLARYLPDAVWHAETLFTHSHCVSKFMLSRAAHEAGFPVVLTGDGADEVFAGYPAFVCDSIREESPAQPSAGAFFDRLGYLPAWHEAQDRVLDALKDVLPLTFQRELIRNQFLDSLDIPRQLHNRSRVDQSLYLFNKSVLPGHVLTVVGDRLDMANSIEARLPFLDHHVVEFSRHLPKSQKIRGGAEKFIVRKAMRGIVPAALCGRRKRALHAPPFLLTAGPLNELMQDTLRGSTLGAIPFLDKRATLCLLDSAMTSEPKRSAWLEIPLMAILTACLLSKKFRL
jgi:asparagine synthase (glutamine-hydrolysing)